ncbi:MAG: ABC transporter substrate-binding protein [Fischerella sp.]|nr:ABC transporter substrate-binding protein [Fischerella sp.]
MKLLFACTNQSKEVVKLSFVVTQREAQYWQPLIHQFNSNNPNIQVELKNDAGNNPQNPNSSTEVRNTYISDLESKSPSYDLIYMDIIWVPEFAQKNLLMDLTQEFSKDELNEFISSEVEYGKYKNKLYRIPFRSDVGVLYYRKDLLDELNQKPPETFEDLMQISREVKEQKGIPYGYLWQGKPSEAMTAMFVEVLYSSGGFWIDENKNIGLDKPEAIKAVEFLRDTIKQGISPENLTTYAYDEQYTRSLFRDSKAVFMRNWPNVWLEVNGSELSFPGKIGIKSVVHAEGKESRACKGSWGFGIAKNTKYKKQALAAIRFFTNAASQQKFTLAYGSMPSRRDLFYEPKIVAKYRYYPELLKMVENSVARPPIPEYAEASRILQEYLNEALNPDNKDYKQIMEEAASQTEKLLIKSNRQL